MSTRLFGTDGVRGLANAWPMTVEVALGIGKAVAKVLGNTHPEPRIIIGKDTRLSGYMFETALVAGICSMGAQAMLVGPMPTPAIAFLTRDMRADAGIVISASHNPYHDNGIKIFGPEGFKLPDELESRIEAMVLDESGQELSPTPGKVGRAMRIDDAPGRYIVFIKNTFPARLTLQGLHIALDCAHGAAYKVGPLVLSELGARLTVIGDEPDGVNINDGVGALHPQAVARVVKETGADVGLALDGDGDRLIMVDEKGQIVDGDQVLAICAEELLRAGRLKGGGVVGTVMSNLGLELFLAERGVRLVRAKVGDRYVVEGMVEGGYNLGGEQSGHLVFLDHNTTGDGLLTALQVLAVMVRSGKSLSELARMMPKLPQKLVNVAVKAKPPLEDVPELARAIQAQNQRLGKRGRVVVRYSGTEPKLRIMVEAEDEDLVEEVIGELKSVAERELG